MTGGFPDHSAHSGLALLQMMIDGTHPQSAMAETLGIAVTEARHGEVLCSGQPEKQTLNPRGGVHGGWYGTLLDTAMGCAVQSVLEAGQVYTTLEYKVNLVRAIATGARVLARARVRHAGRSTAIATGEIIDDEGRLYATGTTTCLIMAAARGS